MQLKPLVCSFTMFPNAVPLLQPISATIACLLCLLLWILHKRKNRSRPLPPGPRALPIIGHLHLLGKLPHQSLTELARVHGSLMTLRLGSTLAVVASSPEMAKQLLQTHDEVFASRPRIAAAVYMLFNCSDVGSTPYGPYHRFMRQLCVTNLLQPKRLQAFTEERAQEMARLVRAVSAEMTGQPITVRSHIMSAANNIVSRMVVGKALSELISFDPDFISYLTELMHLFGLFNLGDFIPWLAWLDLQGYEKRMKAVQHRIRASLEKVVHARRNLRRGDNIKEDLLDALLIAQSDTMSNIEITDDSIIAVLLNMFAAGVDTSSLTVEWALAELLENPTIMEKVYDELDRVIGKEHLVRECDMPQLPYLQAVVYETLRLHPPGPLLVPHESIHPCEVDGYLIPSKTRAYINIWAIGRNPHFFKKPLHFCPDRFSNIKINNMRSENFEFLPFGCGRRGCPGWQLGLLTSQLILATLLQCFYWKLPPSSHGKVNMSEEFGLTITMAQPLTAIPTQRMPSDLYNP